MSSSGRHRPTPPTTTISSRSTSRRRSRSPRSGRSRRRCSTRTAPPARAASRAGGTACGWRRMRPPKKRAMKRARRCLARPRTRQRTMPAPTSPRSDGVDEALLRRGPVVPTTRQRTPPTPPRPHPAGNEGEDFPPLRRGAAHRQRDRGHRRLCRGPAPLPTRPRHTENEEE